MNIKNFQKNIGRIIDNKYDEISDILLQLCALCENLGVNKEMITIYKYNSENEKVSLIDFIILYGQLTEVIMEEKGYRHKKERMDISRRDFIIERISKMFSILFSSSDSKKYINAFENMLKDANKFLENFKKE